MSFADKCLGGTFQGVDSYLRGEIRSHIDYYREFVDNLIFEENLKIERLKNSMVIAEKSLSQASEWAEKAKNRVEAIRNDLAVFVKEQLSLTDATCKKITFDGAVYDAIQRGLCGAYCHGATTLPSSFYRVLHEQSIDIVQLDREAFKDAAISAVALENFVNMVHHKNASARNWLLDHQTELEKLGMTRLDLALLFPEVSSKTFLTVETRILGICEKRAEIESILSMGSIKELISILPEAFENIRDAYSFWDLEYPTNIRETRIALEKYLFDARLREKFRYVAIAFASVSIACIALIFFYSAGEVDRQTLTAQSAPETRVTKSIEAVKDSTILSESHPASVVTTNLAESNRLSSEPDEKRSESAIQPEWSSNKSEQSETKNAIALVVKEPELESRLSSEKKMYFPSDDASESYSGETTNSIPIETTKEPEPVIVEAVAEPTVFAYVSGEFVRMRKTPQINPENIVTMLDLNDKLTVHREQPQDDGFVWFEVTTDKEQSGWIRGDFVNPLPVKKEKVINSDTNVRKGPSTNFAILDVPKKGTAFVVLEESGDWLKVRYEGIAGGWLHKSNLVEKKQQPKKTVVVKKNVPVRKPIVVEPQTRKYQPPSKKEAEPVAPRVETRQSQREIKVNRSLEKLLKTAEDASRRKY